MVEILSAQSAEEFAAAKTLIRDYVESIGVDLSFQNFDSEMQSFPAMYCTLLLARQKDVFVGVVAMKKLSETVCEMKRMYCDPQFRGKGIGRALSDSLMQEAKRQGFSIMRLDTVLAAQESLSLYRSQGFVEIPPYYENPLDDVVYMERSLKGSDEI